MISSVFLLIGKSSLINQNLHQLIPFILAGICIISSTNVRTSKLHHSIIIVFLQAEILPGNYTLPKASENLCFAAKFDLVLNIEYLKFDGKKNITRIPLNNDTFNSYEGTCFPDKSHTLTIYIFDNLTSITFFFNQNEKNQTSLNQIQASITISKENIYFLNHSLEMETTFVFLANESVFNTDVKNSYRCNSRTKIDNIPSNKNLTIKSIDFENVRIQPFVNNSIAFHDFAPGSYFLFHIRSSFFPCRKSLRDGLL